MRQFIRTVVATEGYQEVKKVGTRYVVHLEPVENEEEGTMTCYECMTDEEPDMNVLRTELDEYKEYVRQAELRVMKKQKVKELQDYDTSTAVDSFEIRRGGVKLIDYWIGRDLRTSLEGDVLAAQTVGDTYKFDIREIGISLTLNCTKFLEALSVLRKYAYTAFNVTSEHMAAINNLTTVEAVEAYDYKTGYPEKLVFNLEDLS